MQEDYEGASALHYQPKLAQKDGGLHSEDENNLEAEEENVAKMVRLIATLGGDGGLKAYFMARREGDELLVFLDRVMPPPRNGW